jgi:hypothetical protein
MKARRLIGGAAYPPDELKVIFEAFDAAWAEVAADVSHRASAIEAARLSLATIVLSLAAAGPYRAETPHDCRGRCVPDQAQNDLNQTHAGAQACDPTGS